ncbi:MAG: beta-hydroxyacyl-ACP dehydratase [Pirellulales bacterium]|nr:beta-hydroxyacyl-ACP dehydratase [Pirellulales bacterium]
MRWYWIDRFIEFESGRRAKAVKAVSLAEEHLHDHFPGYPVMPHPLIIEGVAQTGGLLVAEYNAFVEKVILAKISKAEFHGDAVPGDILTYTTSIEYIKKDGAMIVGTVDRGEERFGSMEMVFAHLQTGHEDRNLYEPGTFLKMMRMLGAYDVGHAADGGPLVEPAHLSV